jgi:hypothetical protein
MYADGFVLLGFGASLTSDRLSKKSFFDSLTPIDTDGCTFMPVGIHGIQHPGAPGSFLNTP